MRNKFPLDRMIARPEHKKEAEEMLQERNERGFEGIEEYEIKKTPELIETITLVQEQVKDFFRQYGRDWEDLPLERIHILREGGVSDYTQGYVTGGMVRTGVASVAVELSHGKADLAVRLFHELVHLGSYAAIHIKSSETKIVDHSPYRQGITIVSQGGERQFFSALEEALVQTVAERFFSQVVIKNDQFSSEEKDLVQPAREGEREFLQAVLEQIERETGTSQDVLLEMFLDAQVNGRILPLARFFRKHFDQSTFRRLAEMSDTYNRDA